MVRAETGRGGVRSLDGLRDRRLEKMSDGRDPPKPVASPLVPRATGLQPDGCLMELLHMDGREMVVDVGGIAWLTSPFSPCSWKAATCPG